MKEYSKEGKSYHLFDTKGFELDCYKDMSEGLKNVIRNRRTANPQEHIHIMWYCVSEEGARIEPAEIEFIKEISSEIPVILIFTKAIGSDLTFFNKVKEDNYNIIHHAVRVLALEVKTLIGNIPAHGLNTLTDLTNQLLPEAAKGAFTSSQRVNKALKKKAIDKIILFAASAATAAGASPIPFSDAIVLVPIQLTMIARISVIYGLELETSFFSMIITAAAGITGATYAGRTIVSGLLKLIPGAGSVIGGTISAATAGSLTTAMGYAYYHALTYLQENNIELTADNIAKSFKEQLKLSKS